MTTREQRFATHVVNTFVVISPGIANPYREVDPATPVTCKKC